MSDYEPQNDSARVIQVIETTLLRRGKGTVDSPIRIITQYWSFDGKLLAEVDGWDQQINGKNP